ncbi:hypothetical protein BVRB_5g103830 [Beta vulgaris subsp. vulgaris]|nr:hypothetical protein BVRB_5g103830 [Beta vulgaris subsp. vulgaris]
MNLLFLKFVVLHFLLLVSHMKVLGLELLNPSMFLI